MDAMPGDAPQPGETPREESNPWTFSDPDTAFWSKDAHGEPADASERGPATAARSATLAPPTRARDHTGEAATAHAAGSKDTTEELAERAKTVEPTERDHDQVDERRFSEYATTTPERKPTEPPVHSEELHPPEGVPDVMVLPEPGRTRPTVAFDRGAVPGEPPSGLSRHEPARGGKPTQVRDLSQAQLRPSSPLLENSPFWLTEQERAERAAARPAAETSDTPATVGVAPRRRPRPPRRPATGLLGLVALALVAAFFGWVSAEPFWLAVGHGEHGTATVARCTGDGVTQRCAGQFRAAGNEYAVADVTLLGVQPGRRSPGAVSPARMVSPASRQAYVGEAGLLVQLRWVLGFVLVLICGLGIAGLTGARRLETARARRGALIMSLTGPLLLLAGFLYLAY